MKNQIPKLAVCMLMFFNLSTFAQNKVVFNYTGSDQFYTVPAGVTHITVKAWGAGGAGGDYVFNDYGGGGGYARGVIKVTPGEVFKIIVGGAGLRGAGPGAYGGGGDKSGGSFGGRGGGRSAIRNSSDVELLTAGGGGGGGGANQPNHAGAGGGGGYIGGHGNWGVNDGQGGTQTAGGIGGVNDITFCPCGSHAGSQFQGGEATTVYHGHNGSGGGGYYGGGSGTDYGGGNGGGGSSYVPDGGCTIGATDFNAANNTDPHYKNSAGLGGQKGVNGKNGRVVILPYGFCSQGTPVPISVNGSCDGSISFDTLGGTPPYTFLWSDGYTSGARNNICPGVYYITITDAIGCSKTVKRKWFDPPPFLNVVFTDASSQYCEDGSLTASVNNFSVDSNAVFILLDSSNIVVEIWYLNNDTNASHTFTNLAAGLYKVIAMSGNAINSKIGNIAGPCTFSFNDVTIDSLVDGYYGYGCEGTYEIKIHYNGSACQPMEFNGYYFDWSGNRHDVSFYQSGNYYSAQAFAELYSTGMTIIGSNGSCVDSIFFHPNYPTCIAEIKDETISYGSCGASYSAYGTGQVCNPLEYWSIDGLTNNYHQGGPGIFMFGATGIPDGTYLVTFSNGYCDDTSTFTISGVTFAAPINLTFNQIGTSQDIRVRWEDPCLYAIGESKGYQIQVKKTGDNNWTNYNSPAFHLSKKIPNVISDSTYYFRVRSKPYDGIYSLWSYTGTFCIGNNCGTTRIGFDIDNSKGIVVTPNPAKDLIKISLDADFDNPVDIKVYNQLGKEVIAKNKVTVMDDLQLNVSSLTNGLYIISIITEGEKYSSRFIVNR